MESKYKERATVLLDNYLEKWKTHLETTTDENIFYDDWIIDAMCQLAEEIEMEYKEKIIGLCSLSYVKGSNATKQSEYTDFMSTLFENKENIYTKNQVEELLLKQRELSAERAIMIPYEIQGTGINDGYFNIDRDSILNAKLKII